MHKKEEENQIFILLFERYQKLMLDKQELASLLGSSVSTINRKIRQGIGIPSYIKNSEGSKVLFPLSQIAKYFADLEITKIY